VSTDTIFALSSGRLPAAIAVVRVSGPQASAALTRSAEDCPSRARRCFAGCASRKRKAILDEALVLWFPGPNTETGEDMAELHLHGGRAVVAAVQAELSKLPGFRPAEAGEFTRRAFQNGKLDLTAVEGLADLVFAETEAQRAQAMRQAVRRARRPRRGLAAAADRGAGAGRGAHRLFRRGGRTRGLVSPAASCCAGTD
jgi:tRNA modification GTPase